MGPLHECKKYVHAQKPYPIVRHSRMNQERLEEETKKRVRETGKVDARRLMERKAALQKKKKNLPEELKQSLPTMLREVIIPLKSKGTLTLNHFQVADQ